MEIWRETQVAEVCFVVCLFSLGYEVYLPTEGATHTVAISDLQSGGGEASQKPYPEITRNC